MVQRWRRYARGRWRLPLLFLHSIATVILVHIGFDRLENWRNAMTREFDGQWPRFFIAGLILTLAGFVAGLAILQGRTTRRFDWRPAIAFGIVPFLLALSLPTAIWNWPFTSLNSPLGEFRSHFGSSSYLGAAWLLVGLAIALGFDSKDRR